MTRTEQELQRIERPGRDDDDGRVEVQTRVGSEIRCDNPVAGPSLGALDVVDFRQIEQIAGVPMADCMGKRCARWYEHEGCCSDVSIARNNEVLAFSVWSMRYGREPEPKKPKKKPAKKRERPLEKIYATPKDVALPKKKAPVAKKPAAKNSAAKKKVAKK